MSCIILFGACIIHAPEARLLTSASGMVIKAATCSREIHLIFHSSCCTRLHCIMGSDFLCPLASILLEGSAGSESTHAVSVDKDSIKSDMATSNVRFKQNASLGSILLKDMFHRTLLLCQYWAIGSLPSMNHAQILRLIL